MTFEVLQHCTLRRTNPAKMLAKTLTLAQLIINLLMLHICILGSTNGRMVEWQNSWIAGWQDGRMCCARFLSSHRSRSPEAAAPFPFWLVHISSFLCLPQLWGWWGEGGKRILGRDSFPPLPFSHFQLAAAASTHFIFIFVLRQPQGTCLKITHNLFTINKMSNKKSRRWPPVNWNGKNQT